MADPSPIAGRYALYKDGTDRLVRFLMKTATACRRSVTEKATKSGKISTSDLLKYAQFIAAWNPPPDIPYTMIELTNDVILGRTASADFFSSREKAPTAEEAKADAGHQYFIHVLHKIRDHLKEARTRTKPTRKERRQQDEELPVASNSKEALVNLFDLLRIEEPCDRAWASGPAKQGSKTPHPPEPVLEIDEQEEKRFALSCFLLDLQEIRAFVYEAWDEYARGELSFNATSAITDTALGIIRRADDGFVAIYPNFRSYGEVLRYFAPIPEQLVPEPPVLVKDAEDSKSKEYAVPTVLCARASMSAYALLEDWYALERWIVQHKSAINYRVPETPPYPDGVTAIHPFSEMLHACSSDFWHDLFVLKEDDEPFEFERGLKNLLESKDLRIGVVSNVQIYMGIHELLHAHLDIGCATVAKGVHKTNVLIQGLHEFVERFGHGMYNTPKLLNFLSLTKGFHSTVPQMCLRALTSSDQDMLSDTPGPMIERKRVKIWRSFPAMLGGWMDSRLSDLHAFGVGWANTGGVVLSMAHLYNAARQAGLMDSPWEDMEWVMKEHPKLVLSFGKKRSMLELGRQWCLANGCPISAFSSDSSPIKAVGRLGTPHRRPVVPIETRSRLIQMSKVQFLSDEALGVQRAESIDITLQKLTEEDFQASRPGGRRPKQINHSPNYTGMQLLRTFKKLRIDDEARVNFDYISFWRTCASLLHEIASARYDYSVKAQRRADELPLPIIQQDIIDLLLIDAVYKEDERISLKQSPLAQAADIIAERFKISGNDQYTKQAADLSKGFDPERIEDLWRALGVRKEDDRPCSECGNCGKPDHIQTEQVAPVMGEKSGALGSESGEQLPRSKYAATVVDADECECGRDDCEDCMMHM